MDCKPKNARNNDLRRRVRCPFCSGSAVNLSYTAAVVNLLRTNHEFAHLSRRLVWLVGTQGEQVASARNAQEADTLANQAPRRNPAPENPIWLREMALHARKLARTLPGDEAGTRLDAYADELEARAVAIDRERET